MCGAPVEPASGEEPLMHILPRSLNQMGVVVEAMKLIDDLGPSSGAVDPSPKDGLISKPTKEL